MFDRRPPPPDSPVLLDRVIESACRRIAILSLHPGAGARLALSTMVAETHRRGLPVAVVSAPRVPPETGMITADFVTGAELPAGALLATAERAASRSQAELRLIDSPEHETPLGALGIYRVMKEGAVDLYGPVEPDVVARTLERLAELSQGTVLADGQWDRRAFAAPGVSDGVVLAVGAGYSGTPERSAAAARYQVDTLAFPGCSAAARAAWAAAEASGAPMMLDSSGASAGGIPTGLVDPTRLLQALGGATVEAILLPHGLHDEFLNPLIRLPFRCRLVVRDATRIWVAPVYLKAWLKKKGTVEVVHPLRLVAVATNPVNPSGPDADPVEFRRAVAEAIPELPVHDVILDEEGQRRKRLWRFWR